MARRPNLLAGSETRGRIFQVQPKAPTVVAVLWVPTVIGRRATPLLPLTRTRIYQFRDYRQKSLPQVLTWHRPTLPQARGRIFQIHPSPLPPVIPKWVDTHSRRTLPLPSHPRGRVVGVPPAVHVTPPGPGQYTANLLRMRVAPLPPPPRGRQYHYTQEWEYGSILAQPQTSNRLLPQARGRSTFVRPNYKLIVTIPQRQKVERRQPPLLRIERARVFNYVSRYTPHPVSGPLVNRFYKPSRLWLPSPRGRIFMPRLAPTYRQPWFVPSRRPLLYTQQRSRVVNYITQYTPPSPGPLHSLFTRQSGTQNRILKISRATLTTLENVYVLPPRPTPPLPPSPAGGSVSVSVGRRKWPRPYLYDYPKEMVWWSK